MIFKKEKEPYTHFLIIFQALTQLWPVEHSMGLPGNPELRNQKAEASDVTSGWNQEGKYLIQGHPVDQ